MIKISRKFNQKEKEEIIKLYTIDKLYINTIREMFHCRSTAIADLLKSNNIEIRSRAIRVNKNLNEDYFENIDTEKKAYLLGFITADGSVTHRNRDTFQGTLSLSVQVRDLEVINLLKSELNCESKIHYDNRPDKKCVGIYISNNKIVKDLERYYIIPKKTYLMNKIYTEFSNTELLRHYLRGLVDGDGSLSYDKKNNYTYMYMCGYSRDFIESFRKTLNEISGVVCNNKVFDAKTAYRASWSSNKAKHVIKFLYSNSNCYLTRKYNIANAIL